VPYVAVDEARNATVIDVSGTIRELAAGLQRTPLIASDTVRGVLLRIEGDEEPHRPHQHPEADEAMLVMEGRGLFTVGSEPGFVAGPGSLVWVPRESRWPAQRHWSGSRSLPPTRMAPTTR
jgi:quercetin dioxygenase-like cupin family protein